MTAHGRDSRVRCTGTGLEQFSLQQRLLKLQIFAGGQERQEGCKLLQVHSEVVRHATKLLTSPP